ncbi:2-iminobutanoate/2-iminopropanoate deaminase [Leucobacter exalbidus]|uniref:2-iminobutanoate/2-iminopropanoate deaminase n=1 Tax=Leucobacter exalbidus TaxID=662960 RepID=A0A940T4C2_9MICO|nr:RidA family protein [Leucobacter exalbidus]MBP1326684.1 2-iminobutanoate/2-iminopropanoate deaminase [Leucobacter exalbidus]
MPRKDVNLTPPTESQLYSDAVVANGMVFTTGQMPLDSNWDLIATDFDAQARFVFERLATLLTASGSSPSDVIRLTIYLSDIDNTAALVPQRRAFLGAARPASVIVQTGNFGTPGMFLEVEAIATLTAQL